MKTTKVTYIISNINRALAFEWIAEHLPDATIDLSFILLNPGESELEEFLIQKRLSVSRINYHGLRSGFLPTIAIYKILRKTRPDIIHCHMFDATLLGLLGGWLARTKRRIYTRHHSTYNWVYNKKGILFDKLINQISTEIVAISDNVSTVLQEKEKVNPEKIHLIHHGFDLDAFHKVVDRRVENLQTKINPGKKRPVVGVIARWEEWKGIQYIIPAFKNLLQEYPDALLMLANANGPFKQNISMLLADLPIESYRIIEFENDVFALYQLYDIYVHVPINPQIEAFGQTYVEALAAGIPSVFTLSGVAPEFIEHEKNALVVPFEDSNAIFDAMNKLLGDHELRKNLVSRSRESLENFKLHRFIKDLKDLYIG